jgi:pseudaminic acid biosynthesis-associated methylase
MNKKYLSEQEQFWAGEFGAQYSNRNSGAELIDGRVHLLSNALKVVGKIESAIEFGANIGLNILALKSLFPKINLAAVEINPEAVDRLLAIENLDVYPGSALEQHVTSPYDLVLAVGVLIHINPGYLPQVYENIYTASRRYILVAEYYSSNPVSISYRGYENKLFKRDFAGDLLDKFNDLKLVDYGFCYHRDPNVALDDITWFLIEKTI